MTQIRTWYHVLDEISRARPRFDLSTGQPLRPGTGEIIAAALAGAAGRPGITDRLASYRDLDGAPEFRAAFAGMLSTALGRPVADSELLVVPGAQAALRYVQAAVRAAGDRLLYPVGLEFPGSFDGQAARPPSAGPAQWTADGTTINMDPDSLDWAGVGAVIISQPHSPTGRIWPSGQLAHLAAEAARRDAWLVVDETFSLPAMPLQVAPVRLIDGPAVVHIFSFSKVGLAAERLGVIAARPAVIAVLRGQLRSSAVAASHLGQILGTALLNDASGAGPCLGQMYHERWQALRDALGSAGPARVAQWQGGPFLWLTWQTGPDDSQVFRAVLRRGVAVTPGTVLHATGQPVRGARIGLSVPPGDLQEVGALVQAGMRNG